MLSGLDGEHAKLLFLLGGHAQKAAAKKKKKQFGVSSKGSMGHRTLKEHFRWETKSIMSHLKCAVS